MVECDLAKVEVAGSNPVSRSRICRPRRARGFFAPPILEARYPSGKGEVCKTFMRGFDSHPRLQISAISLQLSAAPKKNLSPCDFGHSQLFTRRDTL